MRHFMKILQIILLIIFTNLYSQKTEYEISLCGRDQKVIIIKNNKTYKGWVESVFFNRNTSAKINKKQRISKNIAEIIFYDLTENGIEIPMEKEEKCGDFYLDGDYLSFSVIKDNKPINKKVIAEGLGHKAIMQEKSMFDVDEKFIVK